MKYVIDNLLKPWFVVLVVFGVSTAIWAHVHADEKTKKEIEYATSLLGGTGVIYTILLTVNNRRASAAVKFAERWNNLEFAKVRREIGPIIREERKIEEKDRSNLGAMLNFFEEMAIAVSVGEAQEALLRRFFKSPLIQSVTVLRP